MKVAVVILNWNGKSLLRQFLPSVLRYSEGADIYVADNASSDDSVAVLADEFPSVKIIQNDQNYGFAAGYNQALQHVNADILALVNSDVEVTANWLEPIISEFRNNPSTAIIQPKILDHKRRDYFEYAGAAGGFIDKFGYPFCRGRIFEHLEQDHGQYDDSTEIFWASGACFFIRREIFSELNGFDADFFAHQEEIDLCWRAFNRGYKVRYIANSTVFHVGGATLDSGNPRKTFLNFRNSLLMLLKNLPARNLYSILFQRMLLDGIAGVRFLMQGRLRHFMAVISAHFAFYRSFKHTKMKRIITGKPRYYTVRSIVYDAFVRKRSTFKSLF